MNRDTARLLGATLRPIVAGAFVLTLLFTVGAFTGVLSTTLSAGTTAATISLVLFVTVVLLPGRDA